MLASPSSSSSLLSLVLLCTIFSLGVQAVDRYYYISAYARLWDYCPDKYNNVYDRDLTSDENFYVNSTPFTLGSQVYKSALIETDVNGIPLSRPNWTHKHIVGPIIRAQVGDTIYVRFKNVDVNAAMSLHPHGVFYNKASEGAYYADNSPDKADDHVYPGQTVTYTWLVPARAGPGPNDPSSILWMYHGHYFEPSSVALGVLGGIIITGAGKARDPNTFDGLMPTDVDREFIIFPNIFDESISDFFYSYTLQNYDTNNIYEPASLTPPYRHAEDHADGHAGVHVEEEVEKRDVAPPANEVLTGTFLQSAQKASLNGMLFGNGFRQKNSETYQLSMNTGERVRWYVFSLGTYQWQFINTPQGLGSFDGFHTMRWYGQSITSTIWSSTQSQYAPVAALLPASMHVVDMIPRNPGIWMLACGVGLHQYSGMSTLFQVNASKSYSPGTPANVQKYFIAIQEQLWDYAPYGYDRITGMNWTINTPNNVGMQMVRSGTTVGKVYLKARYVQYTDETFTVPSTITSDWVHLGMLGPVIRAAVGDQIQIVLFNNASKTFSINPQSLWYTKDSEGLDYHDKSGLTSAQRGVVAPGQTHTYNWYVPTWTGPQSSDQSSIVLSYSSAVNPYSDPHAGLIGPIIITAAGSQTSSTNLAPKDVGRELVVLAMMVNENLSPYYSKTLSTLGLSAGLVNPFGNWMFSLNGRCFGNLDGLTSTTGTKTRLYLISMGNIDGGPHAIRSHAFTFDVTNTVEDVIELLPTVSRTIDTVADYPGNWLLHCHTEVHSDRGMSAYLAISGTPINPQSSVTRTYNIAAQMELWDYAPSGMNRISGQILGSSVYDASLVTSKSTSAGKVSGTIGRQSWKARYWEYPNADFNYNEAIKGHAAPFEHLGILGPLIRAEVGDTIVVNFFNNLTFEASFFPQGLLVKNGDDGFGLDGTGHVVPPGGKYTYTFKVPSSSGPSSSDPSSISWVYYSRGTGALPSQGIDTGLIGAIIITKPGYSKNSTNLAPIDVDREIVVFQGVLREDSSLLFSYNLAYFGFNSTTTNSNIRPSINGRMFGNNGGNNPGQPFYMYDGELVRWYVIVTGTFDGMHTPHWHGNTLMQSNERKDVFELLPTSHAVGDMLVDDVGEWLFHCHVGDHMVYGMVTTYTVNPALPPTKSGASILSVSTLLLIALFLVLRV